MPLLDFGSNTLFLERDHGVPPFNVLDARQGYWMARKRLWHKLGTDAPLLKSGMGRSNKLIGGKGNMFAYNGVNGNYYRRGGQTIDESVNLLPPEQREAYLARAAEESQRIRDSVADDDLTGTSIFDPVLAEVLYCWYCPEGGSVIDPFAGGSVRGVVASLLGRRYHGVDLSSDQVRANQEQAKIICADAPMPAWYCADSADPSTWTTHASDGVPAFAFDFLLTCPPYYDLEVYTDDPKDISNAGDYKKFVEGLSHGLYYAAKRLAENRFAAVVVGDIRDEAGTVRTFPEDTTQALSSAGLKLYCRAVLVTPAGTLPLRAKHTHDLTRKLGQGFQWVLIYLKGDPKTAAVACGAKEASGARKPGAKAKPVGRHVRGAPLDLTGPIEEP